MFLIIVPCANAARTNKLKIHFYELKFNRIWDGNVRNLKMS